ncbi:MAG: glycerol-3-phosphate acyltransferase [Chloroflexi bacterium]|nr:glycerol-3-phosphate acyltransferase [Chloroflexota bacterium]
MIVAKFAVVILIGYLLGAVPFGVMIARRSANVDVTSFGSGKTGATNVLRVAGKKAAAMVLILDVLKGFLPVLFAALIFNGDYMLTGGTSPWVLSRTAQVMAALSAIAGHKWSVFLHFKGGRGVATFFGGLLALCPAAALFGGEILFLGACMTRYASLGSISGAIAAYAILIPLTILDGFPVEYLVYALVGAVFIIIVHRDNIGRLLAGTERRIGERVKL